MKNKLSKVLCFLIVVAVISISLFATLTVKAQTNDFTMKAFDKAYITFVFDDGKMPFSKQCFNLFKGFDMPICYSLIANKILGDEDTANFFKKAQSQGCEILSHTLTHEALHEDNCNLPNIEKQIGDSFKVLTSLGFNVNGIIEVGDGGKEATANYNLIETVTRKYYKYSNAYGVSPQYKKERILLKDNTLDSIKLRIDKAISEKEWLVISAHDFTEFSKNNMTELLSYIDSKEESKAKVVTWNYIYKNFGVYTGEEIPSKAVIESVCESFGHDIENGKIKKKATCTENAVATGKCERCGKSGTYEVADTAGHKFGEYEQKTKATCQEFATLIAKCTVKGCNATSVIYDSKGGYKPHSYYPVAIKDATNDATGLAENKCEYCGKVKGTIIIPKGKSIYDIIYEQSISSQNQSSAYGTSESENQSSTELSKPNEESASEETSSKEEAKVESDDNVAEEVSDFEDGEKEGTVAIILIAVVAVVCLALWGGIGYFIYKNIKKQQPED
ncbi:MAG: polysaccharide deacetylase family protein [Clostridia bacterium]|nr:polysaccharide deacetylase family protein [Clostridia bacterium]